ncbi:MAG: sigma-70 family RNA polymerase sigma factor [Bacteroidales bacterium]|jgi:RNA polymerase sigma factor (sigma-70 family)|nr:sigma-70 family RNA polymerase sigma factor [Bacteroidales bacterium]
MHIILDLDDKDFLKDLYKKHIKALYSYGLSCYPHQDIVEDAIHDVLIDIYRHKEKLNKVRNLQLYLMAAVRYAIYSRLGRDRLSTKYEKEWEDFPEKDVQEIYIEQEEQEEETGKVKVVNELLLQLTAHQREILHLRFSEGLSFNEIAELMQINRQSVQNQYQRIKEKLNKLGKENFKEIK